MTDPNTPFGGVLTAMVTPFTADGHIDLDSAQALAVHLLQNGNDGLVLNGTTGESPTTSDDEKVSLIKAVKEVTGDAVIVAGCGTNDTRHSVELAQQAAAAGADGLLTVTPYYNKPPQAGLVAHFTKVADATDLPMMLYDIPGRSGVAIANDTLCRLAEHPRIVANKDAKGDLDAAAHVLARSDLVYYSGDDALNLPLLSVGAVGFVSVVGHIVGRQLQQMRTAFFNGEHEQAALIQRSLVPVIDGVMTHTQAAISVKYLLHSQEWISSAHVRLPLVELADDEAQVIQDQVGERDRTA